VTADVRRALALVLLVAAGAGVAAGAPAKRAGASLSIRSGGAWREWWRADAAPARWAAADARVTGALAWRRLADGAEWAEARLGGSAPAWRMRLVVARIDPARVRLALAMDLDERLGRPAWNIDRAPREALLAVNAGQFVQTMPWGWVVVDGRQRLLPGKGPLSCAIAVDAAGRVRWIAGDSLGVSKREAESAFQSYPVLLSDDGALPWELREGGHGVNLAHRDARLAFGETRDGRLLLAMTRFDALGEAAGALPIGPTTPEMAAVMGALGARNAVMLDGGISAQLVLREPASGRRHRWPGLRKVPLALLVLPKQREVRPSASAPRSPRSSAPARRRAR